MMEGNLAIELYDLENDPAEQHNLANKHPDIVERIRKAMEEAHEEPEIAKFKIPVLDK